MNQCWYTHEQTAQKTATPTAPQGFWQVNKDPVPPVTNQPNQIRFPSLVQQKDPFFAKTMDIIQQQQKQMNQITQSLHVLGSNASTRTCKSIGNK